MKTEKQSVLDLQEDIQRRREKYVADLHEFLEFEKGAHSDRDIAGRLIRLHSSANNYFNAGERATGQTNLLGAHNNEAWATNFVETCVATLDVIALYYESLRQMCEKYGVAYAPYRPSQFAYANLQRIVKQYFPAEAHRLRGLFESRELPVVGFDQAYIRVRSLSGGGGRTLAATVLGVLFMSAVFVVAHLVPSPSVFQQFVFRVVLGLGGGAIAAIVPGFLEFSAKWAEMSLRAGGGLAVFALVYVWNPSPIEEGHRGAVSCLEQDLALSMERSGDLIPGQRGGSKGRFASGRLYTFTLANVSDRCTVVVEDIRLAVLGKIEDPHQMMEATTATNEYEVEVSPEDVGRELRLQPLGGAPKVDFAFDYAPRSRPDRFAVHVIPRVWGYSYAFLFRVRWYDPETKKRYTTKSPLLTGFFPSGTGRMGKSEEVINFRKTTEAEWRKQYSVATE